MILVLLLLLADPGLIKESGYPGITVLLDQSESCEAEVQTAWKEIHQLLESSRPNDGVIRTFAFAGEALPWPADEKVDLKAYASKVQAALIHASQSVPSDEISKLLLVSDGWSTESLQKLPVFLSSKKQELYWYQVHQDAGNDVRLSHFHVPEQTYVNESFMLDIGVEGASDQTQVEIYRGNTKLGRFHVNLNAGRGQLKLKDHIQHSGSFQYTVQISDEKDSFQGNNRMNAMVQVEGRGEVILISSFKDDPLKVSFEKMGLKVRHILEYERLDVGLLTGAQAVVIHNVDASKIPLEFQKALVPYVELQGGGLAMLGGENSFASGGYYKSKIDPLLPISMELKEEKYKISLALGIILDRSGSMMANTSSGQTKMQLANEGAATAVELLGIHDAVTVFAVDSIAHCIIGLSKIDTGKNALANRIRQIQSQGGGIFVYEGLVNTWERLRNAPMKNKHIILFSDAQDSEQPGEYVRLMEELQREGCTVSVIGLGNKGDADAHLLEDIAKRGDGRVFFTDDAMDLPAIFTQETAAVSRSTFIEESRNIAQTKDLLELGVAIPVPVQSNAFNLCQSRPGASTALITHDENRDPLLAFWNKGAGKSLALMVPMAGEGAQSILQHSSYHAFNASWISWLLKSPVPPGVALEQTRVGDEIEMDLYFDREWQAKFADRPPVIKLMNLQASNQMQEKLWERLSPGQFKTRLRLNPDQKMVGAISVGNTHLSFGPLELGHHVEWFPNQNVEHELRTIARQSGGGLSPRLDQLWEFDAKIIEERLRPWLCVFLMFLVLLEMLCYKLGWHFGYLPRVDLLRYFNRSSPDKKHEHLINQKQTEAAAEHQDLFQKRLEKFKRR